MFYCPRPGEQAEFLRIFDPPTVQGEHRPSADFARLTSPTPNSAQCLAHCFEPNLHPEPVYTVPKSFPSIPSLPTS
jgi:hypothetical protein